MQCTAGMPCRTFAKQLRIFAKQKCGSEGCTDVPRTTTARIYSISREMKNGRAVFLLSETQRIAAHCSQSYKKSKVEKRPKRFSFVGGAHKSCGGNFALRARCKWRGELRFMQCTAGMPCRTFAKQLRIFAKQKCGSEGCTDVPRTTTARNYSISRESKNAEAFFFYWRRRGLLRGKLRTSCSLQVAHCSQSYKKSKVEKRPSRFSFIGDAR